MQWMKRAAEHAGAMIKGILFTGFSIQIILGIFWMCCNFNRIQDFEEPDSALYQFLFRLLGENAGLMYLVQIAAALLAGGFFLRRWRGAASGEGKISGDLLDIWKGFALLTFPFAMQCHLAILPCSFMGSLFLLMLSLPGGMSGLNRKKQGTGGNRRKVLSSFGLAALCLGMIVVLSGAVDADRRGEAGRSPEAVMVRRVVWPTIWIDHEGWPDELREITDGMLWEVGYAPGNMGSLHTVIENNVDAGTAREYYRQMVKISWYYHAPMVIRQIGWDILGYAVTPVIFRMQLEGKAYDSCTGRNYEIMRDNTPVLTRYYVDYGCWWFGCVLVLALALTLLRLPAAKGAGARRRILPVGLCILVSGIWIFLLTFRGAGLMDYKYTIAINELWLIWALRFL